MSNDKDPAIDIVDSPDYGIILICKDIGLADELEDFLTESCFVFFNVKLGSESVSIYFGQASSSERVRALYEKFVEQKR
jgi:hypothetical protein